jgi:hypothetical protein
MEDSKVKQVLSGGWHQWEGEGYKVKIWESVCWKYYVLTHENGKVKPVQTILRTGIGGIKENDGGVNLTKIYCKYFCKCHSVSPV